MLLCAGLAGCSKRTNLKEEIVELEKTIAATEKESESLGEERANLAQVMAPLVGKYSPNVLGRLEQDAVAAEKAVEDAKLRLDAAQRAADGAAAEVQKYKSTYLGN